MKIRGQSMASDFFSGAFEEEAFLEERYFERWGFFEEEASRGEFRGRRLFRVGVLAGDDSKKWLWSGRRCLLKDDSCPKGRSS